MARNLRWLFAAALVAPYGLISPMLPTATADNPIPICPPNQVSGFDGNQCTPQPCQPPFQQGMMPPCIMPITQVCPPGMVSYYNGSPCTPQPCTPPYAPGIPPCFMPPPTIGPNGMPGMG
ncbi:hypothetical protein [Mycolicibacterium fallax]|jgi:hypothetical protein|uniref:Uncharacterized protein n=1 Tax=Mycolicibacterium fallax TaxID=1793 RepID=A0A1X1RLQ9_MYCFA|nr:hypothetical protein [Mycolicibacterium fallax]ORV09142.1 hypothetical protein AWC04_01535 [Mycolicibacterium fallax]BBY98568.1 hypothetical protein MFAL_20350 [Mycolicibacterium fallax]HOW96073.1 hypothetical protein [Mycolicibacterium fallax]HSA40926.1 hypothetical protein [Mycobacterium sp.]